MYIFLNALVIIMYVHSKSRYLSGVLRVVVTDDRREIKSINMSIINIFKNILPFGFWPLDGAKPPILIL